MKEKIERLARGEFENSKPKLVLPAKPVCWSMKANEQFTGNLKFGSENSVRVRGYLLSSDGNLKFQNQKFYGKDVKIEFVYSSKHLSPGDVKKGKIILITNAGEFTVPFEVRILGEDQTEGDVCHG
ncbi:MAG: DUF5717 family protein [Lachnospiraceae bacterium]